MDDRLNWLRAQLDVDDKLARICDAQDWRYVGYGTIVDRDVDGWQSVPDAARVFSFVEPDRSDEALHAVTHDPARVLAEVDAKRRILDEHKPTTATVFGDGAAVCETCNPPGQWSGRVPWPCPTVRLVALPYADRPGYRAE